MRRGTRRFGEAVSEGDGISLIVAVDDADTARIAAAHGAEALVVDRAVPGLRDAAELPILWRGDEPDAALAAGADAFLVVVDGARDGRVEDLHARTAAAGLDCVVEVRSPEELETALERLDPDILLLAARGDAADEHPLEWALELLHDVPAGKLAVADVPSVSRSELAELERAGIDGVIVGANDVGALETPPPEV